MKKRFVITGIIILIFAAFLFYFRPLKLSDLVNKDSEILVTQIELGIKNGEASIHSSSYNDLTAGQKSSMINLFQNYSYRRTFGTAFSDGSLSGTGDEIVHIFIYDKDTLVHHICISTTGGISVNDKTYQLKNASQLIGQITETVGGSVQ